MTTKKQKERKFRMAAEAEMFREELSQFRTSEDFMERLAQIYDDIMSGTISAEHGDMQNREISMALRKIQKELKGR